MGALALVFLVVFIWIDARGGVVAPTAQIENSLEEDEPIVVVSNNDIEVTLPKAHALVASPLIVTGQARAFEGTVVIGIRDQQGNEVGTSFATAQQPDMHIPGPFLRAVEFQGEPGDLITLEVYEESAKSGLPINMVKVPLEVASEQVPLLVFFAPREGHCSKVQAYERMVPKTPAVGSAALELLFAGPTQREKDEGTYTAMPFGVSLESLVIEDGKAKVRLSNAFDEIKGQCDKRLARRQILKTLLEFETVSSVEIL